MKWLTEIFNRRLVERIAELEGRVQHYAAKAEEATELAEARGFNEQQQAKAIGELRAQLAARKPERASVALLREELAQQKRVNNRLANQLLDATGHCGNELTPEQRRKLGIPAGGAR